MNSWQSEVREVLEELKQRILAAERIGKTPHLTTAYAQDEALNKITELTLGVVGEDEPTRFRVNKNLSISHDNNVGWKLNPRVRNNFRAELRQAIKGEGK